MNAGRPVPGPHPKPPHLDPLLLPCLVAATASDVGPGDHREGEEFIGADFTGQDLELTSFVACALRRPRLNDTQLRGAHFTETELTDVDAPVLVAPRTSWRSTTVRGSRLGAAELYESSWRCVAVEDSKINYLNARTATWQDVVFSNCVLDELDLAGASLSRVAFPGCQIRTLDLSHARLVDVDLRGAELHALKGLAGLAGAWITADQLVSLAPLLATHLKIHLG